MEVDICSFTSLCCRRCCSSMFYFSAIFTMRINIRKAHVISVTIKESGPAL